jgi:formylglycine-generating enzyme required for sulfatase activity
LLLEVLGRCISKRAYYEYHAELLEQSVTAANQNELARRFPIARSRFAVELQTAERVRADAISLGVERVAPGTIVQPSELEGQCEGATHVVSEIRRGAFVLAAGAQSQLSTKTLLFDRAAKSSVNVLDEAGERAACTAERDDLVPGCDVPLELVLTPLGSVYAGKVQSKAKCGANMLTLPAGKFDMGCQLGFDNERPAHQVEIRSFCMDRNEVTNGDYAACVKAGKCKAPAGPCARAGKLGPEHPRACVRQAEAETYCQVVHKRLPTEAEWEYAARFGGEGWPFPTGSHDSGQGEACIRSQGSCVVRSYRPESFGFHDLAGNLREWTSGYYVDYAQHARANPRGALTGTKVVARGGYFGSEPSDTRSITRHVVSPEANLEIGFRCASSR